MPPRGRPPQERAAEALALLAQQGGAEGLPAVLTSRDVTPLMGRSWFSNALRLAALPGVRLVHGGMWRCDRDTFVQWLMDVRDGKTATMSRVPDEFDVGVAHGGGGAVSGVDADDERLGDRAGVDAAHPPRRSGAGAPGAARRSSKTNARGS